MKGAWEERERERKGREKQRKGDSWVEVRGKDGGRDRMEGETERKVGVKGREREREGEREESGRKPEREGRER